MLIVLFGSKVKFDNAQTVIILDEIQKCPKARTALKFFYIGGRYDVIGTSSWPGVKEQKLIPVGYEKVIDMYI